MEFTFGIITNGNNDVLIEKIIISIENNKIPVYEIIIVGNTKIPSSKLVKKILYQKMQNMKTLFTFTTILN